MDEVDEIIRSAPPGPAWTTYSNITAQGNSKVHNGHVFHFHQSCSAYHHRDGIVDSSQHGRVKRKRSLTDIEASPRTPAAQQTLELVLKKLGKLSLSIRHRKEGESAEKIAERIAAVFDALEVYRDGEEWDKKTERQLRKLRDSVKWADQVDVNSVPYRKAPVRGSEARARRIVVRVGSWSISLVTTTVDVKRDDGLHELEMFSTLRIEPLHGSSGSPLAVFFGEHTDGRVRSTIPPTVLAYNKVSDGAEIFKLVSRDDVDGVRRLLENGKASIRDCDEEGRSLLHYACYELSPRCCSLLIDLGAEIDRFALGFDRDEFVLLSPLQICDSLGWKAKFDEVHQFFEALLRAGADPTITSGPGIESASESLLGRVPALDSHRLLHCLLKEGIAYIDFCSKNEFGQSYWLRNCSNAIMMSPEVVYRSIEAGADAAEVDITGFNCLFLFLADANFPGDAAELEALMALLTRFDDIFATDAWDNDVFAYVNETEEWPARAISSSLLSGILSGSYKQDLWYSALERSGLAARHDIAPCTRLARYDQDYTPEHYRALCHLDSWDARKDWKNQLQDVLLKYPFSEDEKHIQLEMDAYPKWYRPGTISDHASNEDDESDREFDDASDEEYEAILGSDEQNGSGH